MYRVEAIVCRVCGGERIRWLGVRGNWEHAGAGPQDRKEKHCMTHVVQCRRCGFIYTNPYIIGDDRTGGYGHPETYESSGRGGPGVLFGAILDFMEQYRRPPGRLVDVGCGKGEFLRVAQSRGWSVTGVESSAPMAEFARKNTDAQVYCDPLAAVPIAEASADIVTLNMVLEHVDQPHRFLDVVCRWLRPGGILFVEVPNMDSLMLACGRWYFRLRGLNWAPHLSPLHPPYHSYGYNRRSLEVVTKPHELVPRAFKVTGLALRGHRSGSHRRAETWARDCMERLGAWTGRGDVMWAVFERTLALEAATSSRQKSEAACVSSS